MDELNGLLIHDAVTLERLRRLESHLYAIDLNKPNKLAGFMDLPAPSIITLSNYLGCE